MTDRVLTINIRKYLVTQPRSKRARKAIKYIRERVAHYTKLSEDNVKMSQKLNNLVFKYYSRRMVPVKLNVKIGTDTAEVVPFEDNKPQPAQQPAGKEKRSPIADLKKAVVKVVPKQEPATQPAEAKPKEKHPAQADQKPKSGDTKH